MVEHIVLYLVLAALCFYIVRAAFRFHSWLYPESDQIYRRHLDQMIDRLDQESIFEIGKGTLIRFVEKFKCLPVKAFILAFLLVSFSVNVIVYMVSISVVTATHFPDFGSGIEAVLASIRSANISNLFFMNLFVGSLGTCFDVFSLWITFNLIARASISTTVRKLLTHLGIDLIVAGISVLWAYFVLSFTLRFFYANFLTLVEEYAPYWADVYIGPTIQQTLDTNPDLWYVVWGLGISTAIPTIVYFVTLIPLLAFRLIPRRAQDLTGLILYRLTTDERPVLRQLEGFTEITAAIIAGLVGVIQVID